MSTMRASPGNFPFILAWMAAGLAGSVLAMAVAGFAQVLARVALSGFVNRLPTEQMAQTSFHAFLTAIFPHSLLAIPTAAAGQAVLAWAQTKVLRGRVPTSNWIWRSCQGAALGVLPYTAIHLLTLRSLWIDVLVGAVTGAVLGLLQWTVLRRVSARAWVWVPVCVAGSMLAAGAAFVGERIIALAWLPGALASGLVTGATLAWLLPSGDPSISGPASRVTGKLRDVGRTHTGKQLDPEARETDAASPAAWIGVSVLGGVLALPFAAIPGILGIVVAYLTGGLWIFLPAPLAKAALFFWLVICVVGAAGVTGYAVVRSCQWLLLRRQSPWGSKAGRRRS